MLKEHKKLYKAGKKWLTATITVASFALLSAVNDQKAQADTTNTQTDNQQISTTTVNNHVNQNTNKVSLNGSQVSQNNSKTQFSQSSVSNTPNTEVQNNSVKSIDQTNNTNNQNATPQVVTTAKDAASSVSDGLDPTIYGTVNVKDWDYQENNNILDLTDYHGKDTQHVVVPNLNDFNNAGINIKGDIGVGVTSNVLNTALCRTKDPNNAYSTLAISKTKGNFSDKVIAENGNWQAAFDSKKIVSTDDPEVKGHIGLSKENYFQLTHVDLSNLITTKITDMSYMFNWQRHLIDINGLSNWDTSNVTNMSYMFAGPLLKNVDVGNWDTSNVTNMSGMFDGTQISDFSDIKNWNTSNVVNMSEMFRADDYLTSLDLNNWDTSNVTDMSGMFDDDTQLIHLNVSNWNTSKVTNMSNLFAATALTTLDVNNWDTSNVTDMSGMFFLCKRLTNLDLNNWNTSSLTNIDYMFDDTPLSFFTVSNNNNQFKNQIKLTDPNGLMGERGATVTFINTPTFYRKMDGKTEAESVYETVVPLVKQQADKIYQQFRDRLAPGMKLIYPSEVTLKMDYPSSISDPSQVANAEFSYDSKIGTLKDAVINYVDPDGEIIQSDQLKGVIGSTVPISINLPKGYELADPNETIPTSITLKKGKLQIITINVKKSSAVSETKTGSINYVDQNGNVIKTDQISGQVGSTVAIHVSLPDGYELADPNEQIPSSVTVTKDGIQNITIAVTPEIRTVTIDYARIVAFHPDGSVAAFHIVKADKVSGQVGSTISIHLVMPYGYELANSNENIPTSFTITGNSNLITVYIKRAKEQPGWHYQDGHWYYFKQDGTPQSGLQKINNHWYYFNNGGIAQTGWLVYSGSGSLHSYFYFDLTNAWALTGWQRINNYWYYFDPTNISADIGWQWINGHWYYFNQRGAAETGLQQINGRWYCFDQNNAWANKGWQQINGNWYYFDPTNTWALTSWQLINGNWYYFDNQTAAAKTGWQQINGHWYYFDPTNAWALTGWFQTQAGNWYYFDPQNAWALTGWQRINGNWYYFDPTNAWANKGWFQTQAGNWYYFDPTNAWALTGWQWINGHWYYFDYANAWALKGWQRINGSWYYFDPTNTWMDTGWIQVGNKSYYLNASGAWTGQSN